MPVEQAPGLPEPPEGMRVVIDHDGVDWHEASGAGFRLLALFWLFLLGLFLLVALVLGLLGVSALLGLGVLIFGGLFLGIRRGRKVVLRPDRIWIGAPPNRDEILLDDLQRVRVSVPDSKRPSLVLQTREGNFLVGLGAPEEHLRWFAAAIEQAQHHEARTDDVAGHELFFHRQKPEALEEASDAERRRAQQLSEQRRRE